MIFSPDVFLGWLNDAVVFGAVLMLGALGEIITEKVGNLNLGVPGIMFIGAISGFAGMYYYEKSAGSVNVVLLAVIGVLCAFLASALAGVLFSFITTTLRANQNVTGLTLTIFGGGIALLFGMIITKKENAIVAKVYAADKAFNSGIPWLSDNLGYFGKMFFSYGFMVYLALILAIVLHIFLFKTRAGLNLRAIGESPATADAAGIPVAKYKYAATSVGAGISGLGGLLFLTKLNAVWQTGIGIEAIGWLAVALVIFSTWKPIKTIYGSLLFGFLYKAEVYIPSFFSHPMPTYTKYIWSSLPYFATILVLIIISFRNNRDSRAPSALGLSYFREER